MSKVKIIIWIIILALIGIIIYDNNDFFLSMHILRFDTFSQKIPKPELPAAVLFLAALVLGLVISYVFGLSEKFRLKKENKRMATAQVVREKELSALKQELEALKARPPDAALPAVPEEKPTNGDETGSYYASGSTDLKDNAGAGIRPMEKQEPQKTPDGENHSENGKISESHEEKKAK